MFFNPDTATSSDEEIDVGCESSSFGSCVSEPGEDTRGSCARTRPYPSKCNAFDPARVKGMATTHSDPHRHVARNHSSTTDIPWAAPIDFVQEMTTSDTEEWCDLSKYRTLPPPPPLLRAPLRSSLSENRATATGAFVRETTTSDTEELDSEWCDSSKYGTPPPPLLLQAPLRLSLSENHTTATATAAVVEQLPPPQSTPDESPASSSASSVPSWRSIVRAKSRHERRKNFCPFCEKLISNFGKHLVTVHSDRDEMSEYLALNNVAPEERKARRTYITNRIKNLGNETYNREIVQGKRSGSLLPVKRSTFNRFIVSNTTHVSCKHCLGFFKKNSLYRHLKKCKQYLNDASRETPDGSSARGKRLVLPDHANLMVHENEHANELLRNEVFPKMKKDGCTVIAQSDALICKYGSDFRFTRRGTKQVYYCSSRMRTLASLCHVAKTLNPEIKEFRDCIRPKNFDLLMESVRRLSKFDPACGVTKTPSVPPRLCSSLKRCANIIKSDTIKSDVLTREQKTETICELNDFLHLMDKDWATEVGTNSENSRRRQRVVKEDLLPDPDDIRRFSEFIHEKCPRYVADLNAAPTVGNYEKLAKLIIAHIITFNRRRPNESVEITLEAYHSTLEKRTDYGHESQSVLTPEELESAKELTIFYAAASKNLKKVPVLLTKPFHEAVEALIASHTKVGVESRFLFGRVGNRELFDGSVVLREMVNKAGLKNPASFTANALRHHAATSSQLRPRDDNYARRLSKFMGHDLRTHEHYYEMPLPLVQKTVVGHRFLQEILPRRSNNNNNNNNDGETESTPAATVTSDAPCDSAPQEITRVTERPVTRSSLKSSSAGADTQVEPSCPPSTPVRGGQDGAHQTPGDSPVSGSPRDDGPWRPDEAAIQTGTSTSEENRSCMSESPPKKTCKRKRWSIDEKNTIYEKFGQHFILELAPTRSEIKKVWEEEENLQGRTLQQVVAYVSNIVKRKHQIPTPVRKKIQNMVAKGKEKLSPLCRTDKKKTSTTNEPPAESDETQ